MADECITPYSKICTLDSNLINGDVQRAESGGVARENKILLALMSMHDATNQTQGLYNDVDDAEDVSCCNDTVM